MDGILCRRSTRGIATLSAIRYLSNGVAPEFHELFPTSDLFLLPAARHLVQMDEPEEVVRLIFSTPAKG